MEVEMWSHLPLAFVGARYLGSGLWQLEDEPLTILGSPR
jgi:hypothetical protein